MKNQSNWALAAAKLCIAFGEEDGIDPRYLANKTAHKKTSLKTLQLCKETQRIVSLMLIGEVHDPLLRDLQVMSVQPEQNGQALCVTVGHIALNPHVSETAVLNALQKVQGLLRCALAQAINRKQTPRLTFRYVGVMTQGGG